MGNPILAIGILITIWFLFGTIVSVGAYLSGVKPKKPPMTQTQKADNWEQLVRLSKTYDGSPDQSKMVLEELLSQVNKAK